MKELDHYIQSYFGVGDGDITQINALFQHTEVVKNQFILKSDQYSSAMHFVKSGYLRVYAYTEDHEKEVTQWIAFPGTFITDLSSFMFGNQSRWNIQALSDCELYTISKDNYSKIGSKVPNWDEFEKLFMAKCFVTLENRVFAQLSMNAEQKVAQLLANDPEIFLQVPLQYIASMLGMTPETLSRVRKKMSS